MSTVNDLVNYLNPKKHKWRDRIRGKYHLVRIDHKFMQAQQNLTSPEVTKVGKTSLPSRRVLNDDYVLLNLPNQKLFVTWEQQQQVVTYYFQRIQQGVATYIRLDDVLLPEFDESMYQPYNGLNFIEIELQYKHFYHRSQEKIFSVAILHESVSMLYKKTLKYNRNELGGLTNGKHFLEYKNAHGADTGLIDKSLSNATGGLIGGQVEMRTVIVFLNEQRGELYWYPKVMVDQKEVVLEYNYHPQKNEHIDEGVLKEPAILLRFPYKEGFLAFMMLTYFDNGVSAFDVWDGSMMRKPNCFKAYTEIVLQLLTDVSHNIRDLLRYLYFIPGEFFDKEQTLYTKLDNGTNVLGEDFLWLVLHRTLHEKWLNNIGLDKEDIVLKFLEMINIVQGNEYSQFKEKNDYLLDQLLNKSVTQEIEQEVEGENKKTFTYTSYLIYLYKNMDGDYFTKYNYFIYRLWKNSSYVLPTHPVFTTSYQTKRTDKEEKEKTKPPLFLPYTTNEVVGFYTSSINSKFDENEHIVLTPDEAYWDNIVGFFSFLNPEVGKAAENMAEDDWKITYHPLHPIHLPDPTSKKAIALQPISPALLLKANEDQSFWSNVSTGIEYAADAITTLSGIGNLSKFRHLARISSAFGKTRKVYNSIRIAHAYGEISIGTINALLKITGLNKTGFGKALGDFLFWMEMLTLSIDITDAISDGLRISAKSLTTKHSETLKKQLDNLDLSDVEKARIFDELKTVSGKRRLKISDDFRKNYGKKSLFEIDFDLILKNMKGITDEADEIIKYIEDDVIKVHILDDLTFDDLLRKDGYPEEKIHRVTAMADLDIYLRDSSPVETAMGEIVHEGIHSIDYHAIDKMVNEGTSLEEIIVNFGDNHDFEMRAFLAEQKFQKEAGLKVDHKDYFAVKEHIEELYPNGIYIEEIIEEISDLKNKE
ncbi:MAG: hypothetical protein AAF617_03235 [Bacteroidota bacterium]